MSTLKDYDKKSVSILEIKNLIRDYSNIYNIDKQELFIEKSKPLIKKCRDFIFKCDNNYNKLYDHFLELFS